MSVDVLQEKIRKLKNPTAVNLDLRAEDLPMALRDREPAEAFLDYGTALLEALADVVPAVKCNTAYFEALGPAGLETLGKLTARARALGLYVILETMRADLEEAAALGAGTYFGPRYGADALCVCAFTGSDGVRPYLAHCREGGKALFLLAKTPNRSGREVQDLLSGDRVIYTVMTDLAVRWGGALIGPSGYGSLGVSVGATHPEALRELRARYDRLFLLVPGYGLPGGGAKSVQHAFDQFGHGAVVSDAGAIRTAWQKAEDPGGFAACARAAAEKMRGEIRNYVTVMG